jgi:hypothetical protein
MQVQNSSRPDEQTVYCHDCHLRIAPYEPSLMRAGQLFHRICGIRFERLAIRNSAARTSRRRASKPKAAKRTRLRARSSGR